MNNNPHLLPSVVLFSCTAVWGIFWLPLRHIEAAGISGEWAVFAINFIPLLCLVPFAVFRKASFSERFITKCLIGIGIGGGMALYAIAFLYTTILKTTLLFYMSPIWATLLSMLLLKEKISITRWIAIGIGFAGILLLLSGHGTNRFSLTLNYGDWLALLSGLLWGFGTVLLRGNDDVPAVDFVPGQYFWATVISVIALMAASNTPSVPSPDRWIEALPLILGFYCLIIIPTIFIATRCAQILSPGRVCLLMMSEVLVAGISAPILAGESISVIEWFAGSLIIAATIIEVYSAPQENDDQLPPGITQQ